jgi:hypothetical protein
LQSVTSASGKDKGISSMAQAQVRVVLLRIVQGVV